MAPIDTINLAQFKPAYSKAPGKGISEFSKWYGIIKVMTDDKKQYRKVTIINVIIMLIGMFLFGFFASSPLKKSWC